MFRGRSTAIERVPKWLRWILILPLSLGAGFVVAAVINFLYVRGTGATSGWLGYVTAFVSGVVYVWAALHIACLVAPTHKRTVAFVLGILLLGDLAFVHLVMQPNLLQQAPGSGPEGNGLGVLLNLLRANDYSALTHRGVVKVAGAIMGAVLAWRTLPKNGPHEMTS